MNMVWASDGVNVTVNGQTVSFLRGASGHDLLDALQTYPPEHRELVAPEFVSPAKNPLLESVCEQPNCFSIARRVGGVRVDGFRQRNQLQGHQFPVFRWVGL